MNFNFEQVVDLCVQEIEELIKTYYDSNRELHIVSLSDDPSSRIYMNKKVEQGEKYDVPVTIHTPNSKDELIKILVNTSTNPNNRIIVQKPFDEEKWGTMQSISAFIPAYMDVDGFQFNLLDIVGTKSYSDMIINPTFSPTAKGVLMIMNKLNNGNFKGSRATVLGKGITSGLPIGIMASQLGCSVRWANSNTEKCDLKNLIDTSTFVIGCTGVPNIINADYCVNKEHIGYYINVGMTKVNDKWYGDVNFDSIKDLPNTVYYNTLFNSTGKLTTLCLILNTLL